MCNYLPWPTPFMDGVIRGMSMLGDIERGEMLIVHIQIEGGAGGGFEGSPLPEPEPSVCAHAGDRMTGGREGRANSFSVRGILSTSRLYAMTAMSDGRRMDGWLQSAHSNATVASFGRCGVAWGHSRTGMGEAASETETRRRGKGLDRRECIWLLSLSLSLPLPLLFCSVTGGAMGQRGRPSPTV